MRVACLLLLVLVPSVCGFPAPKPKEPLPNEHLILGTWFMVGANDSESTRYEFTAEGIVYVRRAGFKPLECRYAVDGDQLRFSGFWSKELKDPLRVITLNETKLIYGKDAVELRRF